MHSLKVLMLLFLVFCTAQNILPQDPDKEKECPHEFEFISNIPTTQVKSQGRTGTCWAFATTSFIETELMRMGKGEFDISEMFFVRHCYLPKAEKFVRYHGKSNFSEGGQAHDVMMVVEKKGIVTEKTYNGKKDKDNYNHREMASVLEGMLNEIIKKKGGKLTSLWKEAYTAILDVYLGNDIDKFMIDDIDYTPKEFAESTGLNPSNYIEFTSYSHHPFYEKINLEIPDNWLDYKYYNVPINDLISIIDYSLNNGYTICWDGDVGSDNFNKAGYAVVPVDDEGSDSDENKPENEQEITQETRQTAFNDYSTTDDHLMHIVGIAKNQEGTKFYYTKNSWGIEDKGIEGYWYLSEQFVRLKTIAIMVHKSATPEDIKLKLNY
ncbi:C1 family peptidase [Bacteroidota bacterium]